MHGLTLALGQLVCITAERDLARTLDHVHAAVFTSRAESGTNLFATQTLGMGIPTLVSNNTGHTELVNLGVRLCYEVPQMAEVDWGHSQMQHWGETDVMEVVRQLANVYQVQYVLRPLLA